MKQREEMTLRAVPSLEEGHHNEGEEEHVDENVQDAHYEVLHVGDVLLYVGMGEGG